MEIPVLKKYLYIILFSFFAIACGTDDNGTDTGDSTGETNDTGQVTDCSENLAYITWSYLDNNDPSRLATFSNSGTRFDGWTYLNGLISSFTRYDDYGIWQGSLQYFYQQGMLTSILFDGYAELVVEHDGTGIQSVPSQNLPEGIPFDTRVELDSQTQKIIRYQIYKVNNGTSSWGYFYDCTFHYDASMENLIQIDYDRFRVSTSGDLEFLNSASEYFTYHEDVLNPAYEVYNEHIFQMIFSEYHSDNYFWGFFDSFTDYGSEFSRMACFSKNVMKSYESSGYSYETTVAKCSEMDNRPTSSTFPLGNGIIWEATFNYE